MAEKEVSDWEAIRQAIDRIDFQKMDLSLKNTLTNVFTLVLVRVDSMLEEIADIKQHLYDQQNVERTAVISVLNQAAGEIFSN